MPAAVAAVAATAVNFAVAAGSTAVGSFVLKTVATMAISAVANKLGRQKSSVGERQAQAITLSIGEVPREAVFGTTRVGGSLVDIFNFGGKYATNTVTYCVALADHAIAGIEGYYVDDVYYGWAGEGLQAAFSNRLSFHFRNANAAGYDPPEHVRLNSDWTNADRLCGVTHMWIDVHSDEKVWTQGLPKISFVINGLKAFDPRHDPANGYVGDEPMTWDNPSSHRFTRNPVVQRYAFTRGIYVEGRHGQAQHLLFGRGLSNAVAPSARQIAHANVCDEFPDGDSPTGRRRYVTAGAIQANLDFVTVEQMFAAAMAGVILQRDGSIEIEPGQAKPALITITDDDLVVGEPITWSAFLPDKDGGRINSVIPRYVEPAQGFKDHAGPVRRDVDDIATDGGPRELTLSLPLVPVAAQADDLAEIARRMARLEGRGGVTLPPRFSGVEEGDWIAWTSALKFGGATVICRVESFALDQGWRNRLALRQMTAAVFGSVDVILSPVPAPPVVAAPGALILDNVVVTPITLPPDAAEGEEPGPGLPALRFTWDVPGPEVVAVEAQVRTVGGGLAVSRSDAPLRGELTVTNGVTPGAEIEARLLPIGDAFREVANAGWTTVTTEPLTASISDETRDSIVTEIRTLIGAGEEAERVAELVIETMLNEQQSLEREQAQRVEDLGREADQRAADIAAEADARGEAIAAEAEARGEAIAVVESAVSKVATDLAAETSTRETQIAAAATSIALVESTTKTYADDKVSSLASTVYTKTQVDTNMASQLTTLQLYADDKSAAVASTVYTKAETDSAVATSLATSKTYADDKAAGVLSTVYTKAETDSAVATSLATSKTYADDKAAEVASSVYTKAQTDAAVATSLSESKTYADDKAAGVLSSVYTKAETDSAVASSLATSKTYADDQVAIVASTVYTKTETDGFLAETLTASKTYADDKSAGVLSTVYTKAETDSALATTLASSKTYADEQIASTVTGYYTKSQVDTSIASTITVLETYADTAVSKATALLATKSELDGVAATAGLALSTANGEEASAVLFADSGGKLTAIKVDGVERAIDIVAEAFRLSADGSSGVAIDGENGVVKVFGGGARTMIYASGGLTLWAGPDSITEGAETLTNGYLGVGASGAWFGGETLTGPFDSGLQTGSLSLTGSWQDAASVSKTVLNGYYLAWPAFFGQGVGAWDSGAEVYRLSIEWRVVTTDTGGGDVQVLDSGTVGRTHPSNDSFASQGFAPERRPGMSIGGSKSGDRRIVLQVRLATGASGAVTNRQINGFYAA